MQSQLKCPSGWTDEEKVAQVHNGTELSHTQTTSCHNLVTWRTSHRVERPGTGGHVPLALPRVRGLPRLMEAERGLEAEGAGQRCRWAGALRLSPGRRLQAR